MPDVLRALHDEPEFGFEFLADLAGVDTGDVMQVVYHLWSETDARTGCGSSPTACRATTRASLGHLPVEGRRVDGARGLRHVRHHLRGQPRPAPDLHAARLPELPAAQGLLPAPTTRPARRAPASATWSRPTRRRNAPPAARSIRRTPSMTDDHAHVHAPAARPVGRPAGPRSSERDRRLRADPAVPAADRARGRVLHARRRRDVRQHGPRSTRRPTACCGSCSRSTASTSWTSTRSSATSTAASRSSARTPTTTTRSPTSTRSSTSPRCSASGRRHGVREAARRRGAAPGRVHPGPRRRAQPDLPATPCSSAGWRSTSAA